MEDSEKSDEGKKGQMKIGHWTQGPGRQKDSLRPSTFFTCVSSILKCGN